MPRAISPISKKTLFAIQTLGSMIKASRLERNMSQEMLATRLNITRLTVSSIEKGNVNVSIGTVFEAATILNIPLLSEDAQANTNLMHFNALLPKRGGRKKKELNDDF